MINSKLQEEILIAKRHPLSYGSLTNLIRILITHGGVDYQYFLRIILITFFCCQGITYRLTEKLKFNKTIDELKINKPPVFIIGHWRSGTTYLHDLMSQDPNFSYVSTRQAWAPETFLLMSNKLNQEEIDKIVPTQRAMDNVKVSIDSPAEEEWAVANICDSSYHQYYFPKRGKTDFSSFNNKKQKSIKENWKKAYLRICKKATIAFNGKRLLLKNPANTTKIQWLLEMFPDAKFIHIYRNPYKVYASKTHSAKTWGALMRLQSQSEVESETRILNAYKEHMQFLFDHQTLIPQENFWEIRYEDFIGNEIVELEKIYQQFDLMEFEQAKTYFQTYLDSHRNYKTNKYSLDEETIAKVYNAWQFTIDKWQYSPPQ